MECIPYVYVLFLCVLVSHIFICHIHLIPWSTRWSLCVADLSWRFQMWLMVLVRLHLLHNQVHVLPISPWMMIFWYTHGWSKVTRGRLQLRMTQHSCWTRVLMLASHSLDDCFFYWILKGIHAYTLRHWRSPVHWMSKQKESQASLIWVQC